MEQASVDDNFEVQESSMLEPNDSVESLQSVYHLQDSTNFVSPQPVSINPISISTANTDTVRKARASKSKLCIESPYIPANSTTSNRPITNKQSSASFLAFPTLQQLFEYKVDTCIHPPLPKKATGKNHIVPSFNKLLIIQKVNDLNIPLELNTIINPLSLRKVDEILPWYASISINRSTIVLRLNTPVNQIIQSSKSSFINNYDLHLRKFCLDTPNMLLESTDYSNEVIVDEINIIEGTGAYQILNTDILNDEHMETSTSQAFENTSLITSPLLPIHSIINTVDGANTILVAKNYQMLMESKPLLAITQLQSKLANYFLPPPNQHNLIPLASVLTDAELLRYNCVEINVQDGLEREVIQESDWLESSRIFHSKRCFIASLYLADTYNKISKKDANKPYQMQLEELGAQELTVIYTNQTI